MIIITIGGWKKKLITLAQLALLLTFLGFLVPKLLSLVPIQFDTGQRERGIRVEEADQPAEPVSAQQKLDNLVIKLRQFYQIEKQ